MSDPLSRVRDDLRVMQQALALRLSFGARVVLFQLLLSLAAATAAFICIRVNIDWAQQASFAATTILVVCGLFLTSRQTNHEINLQILMSVTVYAVVWTAACGYAVVTSPGLTIGATRVGLLYAAAAGLLLTFTVVLVRAALRNRGRRYCLGLAVSTLLAGTLLPIVGHAYLYAVAHGCLAAGCLTACAIQWRQLQEAATRHAAD